MMKIAVIGFGVVGSGVVDIIHANKSLLQENTGEHIEVKKILDIRSFPQDPHGHLITANAEEIFEDPEIDVIVETMGGTKFAYDYSVRALKAGKHLVTSNKEMVAAHGPELLQLAKENGVRYLFEASVGGGIPIIRPLTVCLAANHIHEIFGILNGTTNYILTQMKETGKSFAEALKEAQEKGYAEADPTADVEGFDAVRKIAILSSVAYNEFVDYKELYCEGITQITGEDIRLAEELGYSIKLIGHSRKDEKGILARVSPMLVPDTTLLSDVNAVFNAVMVRGDFIGETMYYGQGAGKEATASAVVGDIVDIACNPKARAKSLWDRNAEHLLDASEVKSAFFVRYQENGVERAIITEEICEQEIEALLEAKNIKAINKIRVMKG